MVSNNQPTNPVVPDNQPKDEEPAPRTFFGAKLTDKPDGSIVTLLAEIFVQVINFRDCSTRATWWTVTVVFGLGELFMTNILECLKPGDAWQALIPMAYLALSWLAVSKRRLEDADRSTKWMCLQCVSLLCIIQNILVRCQLSWAPYTGMSYESRALFASSNASTVYYMAVLALVVNVTIFVVFGGTKSMTYTNPEPRYISYC